MEKFFIIIVVLTRKKCENNIILLLYYYWIKLEKKYKHNINNIKWKEKNRKIGWKIKE